ncbi:MAG: phage holin family protein [Methylophilus sp.]|nr:phage holin family protein [Methylophilus sp.]
MFASILKMITFYLIGNRISEAKQDLIAVKDNAADYAESRVMRIKLNVMQDLQRIVNSFIGFLVMFSAIIFSGLLGLMWLFATAWQSPNRELILGIAMLVPLCVSAVIYLAIKASWQKKPILNDTTELISNDWQTFRHGLDGTADTSDEANR